MKARWHTVWTLQDAKNRFSEVVREAIESGPQTITRRGQPTVVVVDANEFARLSPPRMSVRDFFLNSPLANVDFDLTRSRDELRAVDLSGMFGDE